MRRPLEGIKVLDLTHGVAGPYCTMVLGDLGAEIVQIEKSRLMAWTARWPTRPAWTSPCRPDRV